MNPPVSVIQTQTRIKSFNSLAPIVSLQINQGKICSMLWIQWIRSQRDLTVFRGIRIAATEHGNAESIIGEGCSRHSFIPDRTGGQLIEVFFKNLNRSFEFSILGQFNSFKHILVS